MRIPRTLPTLAFLASAAVLLTGCVDNSAAGQQDSSAAANVKQDQAAVALLPDSVKTAGVLTIGTDATYAPNEYKDANGDPIGWEVELADAMAAKLGLTTKYEVAKFDNILPGILGGKYDLGLSSFFDTQEREKQVDMVDYYTAGIQWATPAGKSVDPNNACGVKVAAQNGTTQALEDLPAKSKACTDAGKPAIDILGFDTQDEASNNVVLGRADAMTADSPVIQYAVKQSGGKLELAGDVYDVFFYGMPVAKGSDSVAKALQASLQSLLDDGTYLKILSKWGVEPGAIDTIGLNQADR
ncbi:ABC transporter substrate-binding protein [Glaciibacter sp. 2TAF33]|uniref:ABC transporter substrate-binding protein n=1 Tax=Glaciibacter sp. 2TAF33 TaxID=3233015 RepID=UPI003F8DC5DB